MTTAEAGSSHADHSRTLKPMGRRQLLYGVPFKVYSVGDAVNAVRRFSLVDVDKRASGMHLPNFHGFHVLQVQLKIWIRYKKATNYYTLLESQIAA
ncbi:unnamed protein product [Victoria cruziana]